MGVAAILVPWIVGLVLTAPPRRQPPHTPGCPDCQVEPAPMTNPRLIVLEEEERERLQQVSEMLAWMAAIGGSNPELIAFGSTLESLVARYEDGLDRHEMALVAPSMRKHRSDCRSPLCESPVCAAERKLRAAFNPAPNDS